MTESADDKDEVDRAFAELVAGFHLTADRPDPPIWDHPVNQRPPGSVFEPPPPGRPIAGRPPAELPPPEPADEPEEVDEPFDPGPVPPLPRPAWPVALGWIGVGYALVTVLAIAVGFRPPIWAAWAALIGFVGGFGLLVSRLPRQRPPGAGDGAVL